ncbi:TPA: nickel pincer cofactor biosynthesis protein LarC [Candidatus Woesearchaeota archaeon]|nr:nickel pincer cofactor biosynthesis protein LarC [Candidatus Woesearchaeota archaeon]
MSRIIYFDCFSGISGNMLIGSLLDLRINDVDSTFLKAELKKLNLKDYELIIKKTEKHSIAGTYFDVHTHESDSHSHKHSDHIHTRNLSEISKIIDKSKLSKKIKSIAKKIFLNLARAEAKVHNISIDKIHFHEVGAIDAIIDITGSVILLHKLDMLENVYCSPLNLGQLSFSKSMQGIVPTPGPATLELAKNAGIEVFSSGIRTELTTPTGAAIISTLSKGCFTLPYINVEKIGYGAGTKNLEIPNLLRAIIGNVESAQLTKSNKHNTEDAIFLIETNIDDMNPQLYDYLIKKLFENNALDVYLQNIVMKKHRPAQKLSVIAHKNNLDKIVKTIFSGSTTFGIRIAEYSRIMLDRKFIAVKTKFGKIRIKLGYFNGEFQAATPEYEDCKSAATKHKVPLKSMIEIAKAQYLKQTGDLR